MIKETDQKSLTGAINLALDVGGLDFSWLPLAKEYYQQIIYAYSYLHLTYVDCFPGETKHGVV